VYFFFIWNKWDEPRVYFQVSTIAELRIGTPYKIRQTPKRDVKHPPYELITWPGPRLILASLLPRQTSRSCPLLRLIPGSGLPAPRFQWPLAHLPTFPIQKPKIEMFKFFCFVPQILSIVFGGTHSIVTIAGDPCFGRPERQPC